MIRGFKGSLFLVIFLALMVPSVHGDTLEVGSNYTYSTIQSAIDAASDGYTVIVYSGAYPEDIVIDKPLTLTGDGEPVIESQGGLNAVSITVDGVVFQGFSVTDASSGAGISIESSDNVVSDNKIENSTYGVHLVSGSSGNTVLGNVCVNTSAFIGAFLSSKNLFQDNNATGEVFARDSYSYDNSYWFGEALLSGSFFNLGLLGGEAPSGYRGRSPVFNLTFTGDVREGEAVVVYPVDEDGGSRWLYVGLIAILAGIVGLVYIRMKSTEGYM